MNMFSKFESTRSVSSSDKKHYSLGSILAGMVVMNMVTENTKKVLSQVLGHPELSVYYKFLENQLNYKDGKTGKIVTTTRSVDKYFRKHPTVPGNTERVSIDEGFAKMFAAHDEKFVSQDDVIVRAVIWLVNRSLEVEGSLREQIDTLWTTAAQNASAEGQQKIAHHLHSKGLITDDELAVSVPAVEEIAQ